jgi:hypothetical protein
MDESSDIAHGNTRVKVMIRLRPPDRKDPEKPEMISTNAEDYCKALITNPFSRGAVDQNTFEYDRVYGSETSQEEVFEFTCKPLIE